MHFHGDSAAALLRDGKLIAAAEEEPFRLYITAGHRFSYAAFTSGTLKRSIRSLSEFHERIADNCGHERD